jgi:A/G-specific adenine glycosylase
MQTDSTVNGIPLVNWYHSVKRDLPWRHNADPYRVWISEIILQQTRVSFGIDYFHRFLEAFPDVRSLAKADESEVLRLWQGLGYYSRARNLHAAANQIVTDFNGVFPHNLSDILKLKGVGPYTAGAIASISFGMEVPAVDGNALRVGARFWGIESDILKPKTASEIGRLLSEMMEGLPAGEFNQAIMELGSLICKVSSPECHRCPLQGGCIAHRAGQTGRLPLRLGKTKIQSLTLRYSIAIDESGRVGMVQRTEKGIWRHLWEFPSEVVQEEKLSTEKKPIYMEFTHLLTHRRLEIEAYLEQSPMADSSSVKYYSQSEAAVLAKPVPVVKILQKLQSDGLI